MNRSKNMLFAILCVLSVILINIYKLAPDMKSVGGVFGAWLYMLLTMLLTWLSAMFIYRAFFKGCASSIFALEVRCEYQVLSSYVGHDGNYVLILVDGEHRLFRIRKDDVKNGLAENIGSGDTIKWGYAHGCPLAGNKKVFLVPPKRTLNEGREFFGGGGLTIG